MRAILFLAVLPTLVFAGDADPAAALLAKGQHTEAAEAARELLKKNAKNVDAWIVLADALIAAGTPEHAWTELELGIEANPGAQALSLRLGDVFIRLAEKAQAAGGDGMTITNYYLDAERMYDDVLAKNPTSADALYGKAVANWWIGRDETKAQAKKLLADCLAADKNHGKAHALQADILYYDSSAMKNEADRKAGFSQAQSKYEIAAKFVADAEQTWYVRWGHSCYGQGKFEEAKAAYLEGLKRHPDQDAAIRSGLYTLANIGEKETVMDRRIAYLEAAAQAAPTSPLVHYHLGYSYAQKERFEDALKAYRKAAEVAPGVAEYQFRVGYVNERMGNAREALELYRKTLQLQPDHQDATSQFFRLVAMRQPNLAEAEPLLDELLKLSPNTGWVHNDYALLLRNWAEATGTHKQKDPPEEVRRRLKRSAEIYEIAARLEPNEPQYQSDTGLLFEFYPCIEDAEKAKNYFSRSLELSEFTYRDAFDGLDRICRRTKDWETLRFYAESVVGALEDQGRQAVAPVGASPPRELPNETPGMLARAKAAMAAADKGMKGS